MKNKDRILEESNLPIPQEVQNENLVDLFKIFIRLEYVCKENNLQALSACQIGVPLSLFVFARNGSFEYYFNCSYEGLGENITCIEESCSILNEIGKYRTFEVSRFSEVDIRGKRLDIYNNVNDETFSCSDIFLKEENRNAVIFQHEIDRCRGISIGQIGKEINLF